MPSRYPRREPSQDLLFLQLFRASMRVLLLHVFEGVSFILKEKNDIHIEFVIFGTNSNTKKPPLG
jgi:hypothetical protein